MTNGVVQENKDETNIFLSTKRGGERERKRVGVSSVPRSRKDERRRDFTFARKDGIKDLNDKISGNALWRQDRRTSWVRSAWGQRPRVICRKR